LYCLTGFGTTTSVAPSLGGVGGGLNAGFGATGSSLGGSSFGQQAASGSLTDLFI